MGERELQRLRLQRGLSQTQLAEASGVPVAVIRALERGYRDVNKAQIDTLANLCSVLECRISEILTDDPLKNKVELCEEQ